MESSPSSDQPIDILAVINVFKKLQDNPQILQIISHSLAKVPEQQQQSSPESSTNASKSTATGDSHHIVDDSLNDSHNESFNSDNIDLSSDSIAENTFPSQIELKPWLVPVYWSQQFESLSEADQKRFRKFKGFVFEASNFNFQEVVKSASLLEFCTTEVVTCSFPEFKKNINALVRALVNELGVHYWNNLNQDSTFRSMDSSEVNEIIVGLKVAFPNLATRYRDFFQRFASNIDLACKITKFTFKPTFNEFIYDKIRSRETYYEGKSAGKVIDSGLKKPLKKPRVSNFAEQTKTKKLKTSK